MKTLLFFLIASICIANSAYCSPQSKRTTNQKQEDPFKPSSQKPINPFKNDLDDDPFGNGKKVEKKDPLALKPPRLREFRKKIVKVVPIGNPAKKNLRIEDKLKQTTNIYFNRCTLGEAIAEIAEMHNLKVDIQRASVRRITTDEIDSIELSNISLQSALRILLNQKGLDFSVGKNAIVIAKSKEIDDEQIKRSYYLPSSFFLAAFDLDVSLPNTKVDSLSDVITDSIKPETWSVKSGKGIGQGKGQGKGTIKVILLKNNKVELSIINSREVHEKIAKLLDQLSKIADSKTDALQTGK